MELPWVDFIYSYLVEEAEIIVYWFVKELMSSEDPLSSEVLTNSNNVLSKGEKEKEKDFPMKANKIHRLIGHFRFAI